MHVFELTKPGGWLEGIDDEREMQDINALLDLLSDCLIDAAVSLSLFQEASANDYAQPGFDQEKREQERQQEYLILKRMESDLMSRLRAEHGEEEAYKAYGEAYGSLVDQSHIEAKRLRWQAGEVPKSYTGRLPFLHAKSCLYALDTMHKSLKTLKCLPAAPGQVEKAYSEFDAAFPGLVAVRDSAHHAEDRVQGKKRKARIEPVPVINDTIHAPNGFMATDLLNGNRYGTTLADGSYGEVEISVASVAIAQRIVQSVFDAFQWRGHASHGPF
ncbi:hypothetical protein [Arthrobacter sp. NPDC058192]|uniref:hypothetical protein n=1 Tax=Arthrobacter sp. NPDC058192 TaxID=3346372 RepID=UPI0036F19020